MRVGKSTFIYFASQVSLSLAGFIATFVIARILGADVLGTYSIIVAVIFWFNIPALAIAGAINKRVSEGEKQGKYLSAGFAMNILLAIAISLGIVLGGEYVNRYVGAPVNELLAAILIVTIAMATVMNALKGQKKVASGGVLKAGERVIRTCAQVSFIYLGWELTGLLIGHIASLGVTAVLGILLFEVRPSIPSIDEFLSLIKYARYSWLGTLKARAFGWMDTIVLAFFVSSSLIGIYEVAWRLASMLALVSVSVQQTLFPEISELSVNENSERIHHFLNEGLVFTGIFCIPGLVGTAVIGDRLLKIYSPEFTQGAVVLVVLVLARTIQSYSAQFISAINAIDRPDTAFKINLVFVLTNLVLNVSLISEFGWHGAAAATTLSALTTLGLGYFALSVIIGRPELPLREIMRQIIAAGTMGIFLTGISDLIPENSYLTVALVLLGATVYILVLLTISTRVRQKLLSLIPESVRG